MEMQHLKTVNASFVKAESERWGGCAWVCYWEFVRLWRLHAQELAHAHTLFFFPLGQNQNKPLINSRQHHQAIDWLPSSISLIKPLRPFDKVASNSLLESDWNKFNVWWFDFRKKNNQTLFKIQVRMHQKKRHSVLLSLNTISCRHSDKAENDSRSAAKTGHFGREIVYSNSHKRRGSGGSGDPTGGQDAEKKHSTLSYFHPLQLHNGSHKTKVEVIPEHKSRPHCLCFRGREVSFHN